jgi:hypothetical protein
MKKKARTSRLMRICIKISNIIQSFFGDFPDEFTTVRAIDIGEAHCLSKRKAERPLNVINIFKINELNRWAYENVKNEPLYGGSGGSGGSPRRKPFVE